MIALFWRHVRGGLACGASGAVVHGFWLAPGADPVALGVGFGFWFTFGVAAVSILAMFDGGG